MSVFIANQIIKQTRISKEKGQEKYNAYFVNTRLYESYRQGTNGILETEGYEDVISAE